MLFFQLCYAEEDDDLDVNIEALTRRALRRLCGELTLLEEQGKKREEWVLVDRPLVLLQLGLLVLTGGSIVLLEAGGGGSRGGRWPPVVTWATHLIPVGHSATTSETEQFGYLLRGTSMTSSNLFNHATFVQEVFFNHARKLPNSFQMCLWWVSIAPPARP